MKTWVLGSFEGECLTGSKKKKGGKESREGNGKSSLPLGT